MIDNLIKQGFLQQISIKERFGIQVIKVTEKGLCWINMNELNKALNITSDIKLNPIKMNTSI
jgi:hypothetical protein